MVTIRHGAPANRYVAHDRLSDWFNHRLIPGAIDAAGWCETKVLQVEEATGRSPVTGMLLALGGGMAIGLFLLSRNRAGRTRHGRTRFLPA